MQLVHHGQIHFGYFIEFKYSSRKNIGKLEFSVVQEVVRRVLLLITPILQNTISNTLQPRFYLNFFSTIYPKQLDSLVRISDLCGFVISLSSRRYCLSNCLFIFGFVEF